MRKYQVVNLDTGYFTGNLSSKKLQDKLNDAAQKGWALEKVIEETRRSMLFFKRETKFLVFSKEIN